MLRTLVAGLALATTALALPAAPGSAVPAVDQRDARHDVQQVSSTEDVDPTLLRSVDLRHLTVTHHADGLRVVVRMGHVLPPRGRYVQELAFTAATHLDDENQAALMEGLVFLQHVGGARVFQISLSDPTQSDGEEEEPLSCRMGVTKTAKRVRLDIPAKCVVPGEGPVGVGVGVIDKHSVDDPLVAVDDVQVGSYGPSWFRSLPRSLLGT